MPGKPIIRMRFLREPYLCYFSMSLHGKVFLREYIYLRLCNNGDISLVKKRPVENNHQGGVFAPEGLPTQNAQIQSAFKPSSTDVYSNSFPLLQEKGLTPTASGACARPPPSATPPRPATRPTQGHTSAGPSSSHGHTGPTQISQSLRATTRNRREVCANLATLHRCV